MLLGKRVRPPIKRTTSMTSFPEDLVAPGGPSNQARPSHQRPRAPPPQVEDWLEPRYMPPPPPRAASRRNSGDFPVIETAAFLRSCSLCKRRLGPGRDTFMYRGQIAFCSLECRQQQINLDERKAKCSVASMKRDALSPAATAGSESSNSGESVAAA